MAKLKITKKQILVGAAIVVLLALAAGAGALLQMWIKSQNPTQTQEEPNLPVPKVITDIQDLQLQGKAAESEKKINELLNDTATTNDDKYYLYILQGDDFSTKEQYQAAVDTYAKALAIKETALIVSKLGSAYQGLGDKPKAIQYYTRAMELLDNSSPTYDSDKTRYELMIKQLQGGS